MMLEEKLALRRSLIENKEIQEDADNDLLNQLAEQQISLVMKYKMRTTMHTFIFQMIKKSILVFLQTLISVALWRTNMLHQRIYQEMINGVIFVV
jgi:hypothetical protein